MSAKGITHDVSLKNCHSNFFPLVLLRYTHPPLRSLDMCNVSKVHYKHNDATPYTYRYINVESRPAKDLCVYNTVCNILDTKMTFENAPCHSARNYHDESNVTRIIFNSCSVKTSRFHVLTNGLLLLTSICALFVIINKSGAYKGKS